MHPANITREDIHREAEQAAKDIVAFTCGHKNEHPDYPTERIEKLVLATHRIAIEEACEWLKTTVKVAISVPEVNEGQKVVLTENFIKDEFINAMRTSLEIK